MKKVSIITAIAFSAILFLGLSARAQTLYQPRNVKAAFANGTRAMDGRPGPNYWQNHSNYDIDLTVAPPDRTIKGSEEITYFNESPDTLKTIVFRLTMNYHKPEAGRADGGLMSLDSTQLNSGVHIDRFEINGKTAEWPVLNDHYTWQEVPLSTPLAPGKSIRFSVQWHFEIAPSVVPGKRANREGMVDSTAWFLAYFYPQVAVYDDYNGWDKLPFTAAQEFYNDFGNYNIKVNVPKNYIVWATGTLQNPDEVLQPHYAQIFKESMASDDVIHIATPEDLRNKNITEQKPVNSWNWNAENVTEVALFISDHNNWDAASVIVDDMTGRRASVQAAYYDSSALFHQAVAVGQEAIGWYSKNLPGVAYPYPKMTVVEGNAGMEYPMMVNDGIFGNGEISFRGVENHEIAHSYFPFYMGINESRYAFMDEGWAQAFSGWLDIVESGVAEENERFSKILSQDVSQEVQVPMIENDYQTGMAYGGNAYFKPLWAYTALRVLLGEQLFKKSLLGYMDRWNGKHPIPWDFFNAFNDISGKDLNWFWNNWFFSHGYNDIGVGKVTKAKDGYAVTIKNVGGFAIPFDVKISYSHGSKQDIHKTPAVWEKDTDQTTINIKTKKIIQSITIDTGIWVDANEKDNGWENQ